MLALSKSDLDALSLNFPLLANKVLAQADPDSTRSRFPVAVLSDVTSADVDLSVRFKPISGRVDQAAGLVWRYRNQDNYYIVRANALEDNIVLYKVEGGKRISLAPKGTPSRTYGVRHKVPKAAWCTLTVSFHGPRFEVFFDGGKIMELEDATFTTAGKSGLWTKADSVLTPSPGAPIGSALLPARKPEWRSTPP